MAASSKREALERLADLLALTAAGSGVARQKVLDGLVEREGLGSTGFGNGIAIPHCKVEGMEGFAMALAVCPKGVQFESMDGRSVHILCGIAGTPEEPSTHLRLLAVASRVLGSGKSRHELLRSPTPYALREAFLYHAAPVSAARSKGRGRERMVVITVQESETYELIMDLFLEMDLPGAVTVEGTMMGQVLSGAPVFADFLDVLGRSRPEPRTVITLVPEEALDELVCQVESITGNLDNHRGACIIVLTPDLVRGSLETL